MRPSRSLAINVKLVEFFFFMHAHAYHHLRLRVIEMRSGPLRGITTL